MRRAAATATAAVALVLADATAASADPTPVGQTVSTHARDGVWTVDATCHFGPTTNEAMENRLHVQGVAYAPGATSTTVRCVVESGRGTWVDTYESTLAGPVAATSGADWLWTSADRLCVSAEAVFPGVGTVVAEPVCA